VSSAAVRLALPASLDGAAAPSLAASLLALKGKATDIDASSVEKISTLAVQVLLSAHRTWIADRVPLRIVTSSDRFNEAVARLGLADTLGSPLA